MSGVSKFPNKDKAGEGGIRVQKVGAELPRQGSELVRSLRR